ncbi:MAG: ABC transporter permease [Bacteroidales bacterium]|nr:ABC transporter permease [Bacteroidales bacterium]
MQLLYILKESFRFAFKTISTNKLRTLLSLLGITIGIFAIISVFTIIDSLESNIRTSLSAFGDDIIYVEKWPWAPEDGQEYAWWKYLNRPFPTVREYSELKRRLKSARSINFFAATSKTLKYKNNSAENVEIWGAGEDFEKNRSLDIERGRYFTPYEVRHGKNQAIIGSEVASELFQNEDPMGKVIKVYGKKLTIIGVLAKEGKSVFGGGSLDKNLLVPLNFLATIANFRDERASPMIWVRAAEGVNLIELKEEVRGAMRAIRTLRPSEDDNFALNQTSVISQGINQIFKVINIAGGFIGIFSVLVGAFGIANIMFVSVKERTNIIGIQKAIGAKRNYILFEVLYESVILSLLGGILGLMLIYIGTLIVGATTDFTIYLTAGNIILGIMISTVVGIISGFAPAFYAARLDPVVAIHTTF